MGKRYHNIAPGTTFAIMGCSPNAKNSTRAPTFACSEAGGIKAHTTQHHTLIALEPWHRVDHAVGTGSKGEDRQCRVAHVSVAQPQTFPAPRGRQQSRGTPGTCHHNTISPVTHTRHPPAPTHLRALLTIITKVASTSARHSRISWFRMRSRPWALVKKEVVPIVPAGQRQQWRHWRC